MATVQDSGDNPALRARILGEADSPADPRGDTRPDPSGEPEAAAPVAAEPDARAEEGAPPAAAAVPTSAEVDAVASPAEAGAEASTATPEPAAKPEEAAAPERDADPGGAETEAEASEGAPREAAGPGSPEGGLAPGEIAGPKDGGEISGDGASPAEAAAGDGGAPRDSAEESPTAPSPGEPPSPTPSDAKSEEPPRATVTPLLGWRARLQTRTGFAVTALVAGTAAIVIPLALTSRPTPPAPAGPASGAPSGGAPLDAGAAPQMLVVREGGLTDAAPVETKPARPPVWRIAHLAHDPAVEIIDGTVGRRPILAALTLSGMSRTQAYRVVKAFEKTKRLERCGPKDTYRFARERASGRLVAFELATSPSEVWQARDWDADPPLDDPRGGRPPPGSSADPAGRAVDASDGADAHPAPPSPRLGGDELVARKLDLLVEHERLAVALVVEGELRESLVRAGLRDAIVQLLGDALEGHMDLSEIRPGVRLRMIVTAERVEGEFTRYSKLDAVEYLPPPGEAAPSRSGEQELARPSSRPLRVYHFGRKSNGSSKRTTYYDRKGQQPFRGAWRSPLAVPRISSRFNPQRLHPVLHVVMPHTGVDFAATTGTPVYATAAGVVSAAGDGGACGNMVQVQHGNGLTSSYCHLSRFAAGLHAGQRVEGRQLVGYVGQTGRATGPHLHFAVRRGDGFIDPLSLNLDGVRVLPRGAREEFLVVRAELDALLDGLPLHGGPAGTPDGGADADDPEEEQEGARSAPESAD